MITLFPSDIQFSHIHILVCSFVCIVYLGHSLIPVFASTEAVTCGSRERIMCLVVRQLVSLLLQPAKQSLHTSMSTACTATFFSKVM